MLAEAMLVLIKDVALVKSDVNTIHDRANNTLGMFDAIHTEFANMPTFHELLLGSALSYTSLGAAIAWSFVSFVVFTGLICVALRELTAFGTISCAVASPSAGLCK